MRTIAAGLALGLLTFAAPGAHASGAESTYRGGCGFLTLNDVSPGGQLGGPSTWTGEVDADFVLYSPTYGNAVNAVVSCSLRVNGVETMRFTSQGTGAVLFVTPASYTAEVYEIVELCDVVDYTSDDTPTTTKCGDPAETQILPQLVFDVVDFAVDAVNYAYYPVGTGLDDTVCPLFRALAPGTDPVTVRPDGDVYLDGGVFWDCPPYDTPFPPPPPPTVPPVFPLGGDHAPTGAGWDDGDTGLLALLTQSTVTVGVPADPDPRDAGATCSFRVDRAAGTVTVQGHAAAGRPAFADSTAVHCRLLDASGTAFYDRTVTENGIAADLEDTVAAPAGAVSVCTEGAGTWGTTTAGTGFHCRYA